MEQIGAPGATSASVATAAAAPVRREDAFGAFVEAHLAEQYRLATVILGDATEAQDATHDAFEQAWRHWPDLRDPTRLEAWFGRILVNTCRDHLRRRKRHPVTELTDATAAALPGADELRRPADRDEIGRAFAVLNPDQRLVVVLRFYADLTVDQIAERVDAPAGTVKSRLHHALAALNTALAGTDGGADR
ncbi:MAG: sigma-70 family RNA polymerase sigma factor [Chloroflexota bacterium]